MTDVTTTTNALPALVNTPAMEIDGGDITLPRIRIAQDLTTAVQDDLVKKGCVFASTGADDPAPEVLFDGGKGDGVLIHVLGVRKGKSLTVDGDFQTWAFNDPDAPQDARTTFDYSVCLPEVDEHMPYKWLFTGSSTPAAKLINTVLLKNANRGPAYALAFRVGVKQRSKDIGNKTVKFYVAQPRQVEADPKHVAASEKLSAMIAGQQVEQSAPTAQPAI